MYRFIFTILIFLSFKICQAQRTEFKGYMAYSGDSSIRGYGYLIFPIAKDTILIDSSGLVNIDLSNTKHRIFYVTPDLFDKSKIFRFTSSSAADSLYKLITPDSVFYSKYHRIKKCPICLNTKYLLPIKYGLPPKSMQRLARKGKIRLGGCIVYEGSPLYYCKKDDFSF